MNEWIIPYIKKNKGRMALTVFFAILGVTSGAMLLFVSGYLISKSSLRPENIMLVYVPIVSVRAFSIGQAVFPYLDKLVSHDIVLRILADYRKRLYNLLEPQALFLQSRYQTGDILSVLSDDIEKLQDFYIRTLLPSFVGVVIYGIFAIVLGLFDWLFMLMMIGLLGVIVFLIPFISYMMMKKNHILIKDKRGKLYQHFTDAMFGQLDWLVSGRVDEVVSQVVNENSRLISKENKVNTWHHIRDAFLRFIAGLAIIATMIWANFQAGEGTISATVIAAFVLMMFSITDALLPLSDAVEEIPTYVDSIRRIEKLQQSKNAEMKLTEARNATFNKPTIRIENISYQYETVSKNLIDNLSLTIEPGKKVAILGKSGTGKSTLLKMLAGLIKPTEGKIYIDDMEMNSGYLANAVSVLNQKPHLFHTTIANNIRIGKANATEEEIKNVLKQAQVLEMVDQLPNGIYTQMDEMGKRFSGGERQRVAFARVLIQNTPIILMDEPTTGLDPRTERDLLTTFLEAAKEKTIIWVTHHLAGAELMDKIVFLNEGKIKLDGSHHHLMETSEYYRTLYQMDEAL
ncbi:thiol reductant ABC exporter subunit CydC [Pseudogracilibacillus sp. SO30301A]|uniref:thiol reductant ABC exporter subunit CydC n=1 Tax=Pseudogracilibacillus sp. SO30301A TaxID=3098291 RepID=UPI00300E47D9